MSGWTPPIEETRRKIEAMFDSAIAAPKQTILSIGSYIDPASIPDGNVCVLHPKHYSEFFVVDGKLRATYAAAERTILRQLREDYPHAKKLCLIWRSYPQAEVETDFESDRKCGYLRMRLSAGSVEAACKVEVMA